MPAFLVSYPLLARVQLEMGATIQKGVNLTDVVPQPPPANPAKSPLGNPPQNVNIAFEYELNVSREAFIKAWVNEMAYKIITPGDGVTQAKGFSNQQHGTALSHGAIVEERIGAHFLVSMAADSSYWTIRAVDKLPPILSGVTNIIEVTEITGESNKIKVRILGRFQVACLPLSLLVMVLKDLYAKINKSAESY